MANSMAPNKLRKKPDNMDNIEDILKENNSGPNRPALRVTSSRLNIPIPMATLLETLPEDGQLDDEDLQQQDIDKPTGLSDDSSASNIVFGFMTPSGRKRRPSLLQIAVTSSAQKKSLEQLENSPTRLRQKLTPTKKTPTKSPAPKSSPAPPPQHATPRQVRACRRTPQTPSTPTLARDHVLRTPQCVPKTYKDGPSTPRSRRSLAPQLDAEAPPTTPQHTRNKIKTRIMEVGDDTDYGEDSSDEEESDDSEPELMDDTFEEDLDDSFKDKDYKPESCQLTLSTVSLSDDNHSSSEEEDDEEEGVGRGRMSGKSKGTTPKRQLPGGGQRGSPNKRRQRKDVAQTASSSDYFLHNDGTGRGGVTSDHTLNRLEVPRLSTAMLHSIMDKVCLDHTEEREALYDEHCQYFPKWMTLLSYGYSVFCHGVGSKKRLLSQFQEEHLDHVDHLVVNGFFPSITIRSILTSIVEELMCVESSPASVPEQMEIIHRHYSAPGVEPLYLIVHNIDGPMLRGRKTQQTLSHLCSLPSVRLVASVDHVNAPLVLDSRRVSEYNVLWFDCTTLAPYGEETSYENSLVQQTQGLAIASLNFVFKSLTSSSKSIFIELAQYQVGRQDDNTEGMTFADLYQRCREKMLVNSELTLNAQLTEFKDHKLVRQKKGYDGAEVLSIPLATGQLKDFVEQYMDGTLDGGAS